MRARFNKYSWLRLMLVAVIAGLLVSFTTPAQPTNPSSGSAEAQFLASLGSRGVRVHDPSTIVKCKDEFWVFFTGRGVPSYHSKNLTNWERGPLIFTNTVTWVTNAVPRNYGGRDFWAPDVIHVGNRYLLYYSASSFGKNTSAIGLVTNATLDPDDPQFHWVDQGMVIQSSPDVDFNTIDPAVSQDAEGKLWLAFGSFWSGIRLIQLDPATGKRITPDSPIYSLAHNDSIEASYIYQHEGYYYLFVDWGYCCRGINSTYQIRVGRSEEITGPYLDREGVNMLLGGGSLVLGSIGPFIGPGHAGIIQDKGAYWLSCHFYDATRRGMPTFAILPLKWDAEGWPEIELPSRTKESK